MYSCYLLFSTLPVLFLIIIGRCYLFVVTFYLSLEDGMTHGYDDTVRHIELYVHNLWVRTFTAVQCSKMCVIIEWSFFLLLT